MDATIQDPGLDEFIKFMEEAIKMKEEGSTVWAQGRYRQAAIKLQSGCNDDAMVERRCIQIAITPHIACPTYAVKSHAQCWMGCLGQ